jgi:DNA-binding transcriptional regulator YiaG
MRIRELEAIAHARRLIASGAAKAIREDAQLSLRDVASALRVEAAPVLHWARGPTRPRAENALVYARLLERLENHGRPLEGG